MTAKKKITNEGKSNIRCARFTDADFQQIREDAALCQVSFSEYLRKKALGQRPKAKSYSIAINQLNKHFGLLKHLHNEGLGHSAETAELLTLLKSAIRAVAQDAEGVRR